MAEDNEVFIEDDAIILEDTKNSMEDDAGTNNIISYVMERYRRSEDVRRQDETRWLRAYRNYRGLYGPDVQFTEAEKSRVFIKVTKTKTLAAYGQIVDVLFANNKFPLTVDPTELPDGVVDSVHFDPQEPEQLRQSNMDELISPYGYRNDGREIPKGATAKTLRESIGVLAEKLRDISGVKEGPGTTPSSVTFEPATFPAPETLKISKINAVPITFSSTSGDNNPDILFFTKSKTS